MLVGLAFYIVDSSEIAPCLLVKNKLYNKREESVLFGIKNVKEKVSIG